MRAAPDLNQSISQLVRKDRGRLLAALIASLGSFDLAEDALSDALESALTHWARQGIPDNPQGWLLKVARRKAIDRIRRNARLKSFQPELERLAQEDEQDASQMTPDIPDKRLALIFTCCHPALDAKSRVALTLRTLGGLSTAEIARGFLDRETTMGQRLSRAKSKISTAGIAFAVPGPEAWQERLGSVLAVIYLIFNEGYVASSGNSATRTDLCEEAIYLARLLDQLTPQEPEVLGLLSLLLSTHARRDARQGPDQASIPLSEQDRTRWHRALIGEGREVLDRAVSLGRPGPYQIKAAISALHVAVDSAANTDWSQIMLLYDSLLHFEPTPVVALNRAVALAQAGKARRALEQLDTLQVELAGYQPYHAARADLLARLHQVDGAIKAYDRAISLTGNAPDRIFLQNRKERLLD